MTDFKHIGKRLPLFDGHEKVTGQLKFIPDLSLPGMLHARLVTSPHAHARIVEIDAGDALAVPGVTAVLTAQDLPNIPPDSRSTLLLARDRVIFAGQPVALVLAESEGAALDGVGQVWVEYEPLDAAVTVEQALADGAPLVWPGGSPGSTDEAAAHGADVGGETKSRRPSNVASKNEFKRGDIAAGFAEADLIVERSFTTAMVHQSYLEPFGMIVQPDAVSGGVTVYTGTQAPFYVREEVAKLLGVAETAVRVIPSKPGGAFGAKYLVYELLVTLAAKTQNRPVKLVLTRSEDMLATVPAPASHIHLKLGATHDGQLVALEAELTFDAGCYPSPHAIGAVLMGSLYQLPHVSVRYLEVMTFKTATGAYRAPGTPQATFALETVLDEMAQKLGADPVDLRLRYASRPGQPMIHRRDWPHMGMVEVLEAAQAHPIWQNRNQARAQGRGVGLAIGGWPGGLEPTAATAQLHRDGTLQVNVGSVDLTGTQTGLAVIAAETFGVSPEKVRILAGDTSRDPYGGATGGSKITYMVGPSVIQAAEDARAQVLRIASEEMEVDPADLTIVAGVVQVKGVPDRGLSLEKIARKTMGFGVKYAPVVGNGRYANNIPSPAFCAQLVELSVDSETGQVDVHKCAIIQDVGRAINPLLVEGQMMGGALQGLGFALYEALVFDEFGTPLTGSWMDYALPHFTHAVPELDTVIVEVPSEHGPFGARGVGEPPIIATAAAVANAIADATGGVRLGTLPMTAPRIYTALHAT